MLNLSRGFSLSKRCLFFDNWVQKIPWRRKWQAILVFLPGKSQGQRSLAGYNPWSCMIEWPSTCISLSKNVYLEMNEPTLYCQKMKVIQRIIFSVFVVDAAEPGENYFTAPKCFRYTHLKFVLFIWNGIWFALGLNASFWYIFISKLS